MILRDLLNGIDVKEARADLNAEISGVCGDSRRCAPGDVFVAVRGIASDGHDYIGHAKENGAVCVLCETAPEDDIPYVICENTQTALAYASANYFGKPSEKLKMIGVTGTNGKTTVTHLIKTVIEELTGKPVGLIGTLRDMIGLRELEKRVAAPTTPESYELHKMLAEMADAGCEYAVMEVSSHAMLQERVAGIEYEIGVFMNLTHDHLDYHGTLEAYAEAKSRLLKQSRRAVINGDDSFAKYMEDAADCPVFTFSINDLRADMVAKRVRLFPEKIEFCALTTGCLQQIEMGTPVLFAVYNAMAAVSTCMLLGFEPADIAASIAKFPGVPGRAEVVPGTGEITVVIDYAHSPDALQNIISAIREATSGRVITLFGCGGDRDRAKRPVMGKIAAELSDLVYVTSDNPRTEDPDAIISDILAGIPDGTPAVVIEDRRAAIHKALADALPGDTVILAGKGHETYQIRGRELLHFDEREIVAEAMQSLLTNAG